MTGLKQLARDVNYFSLFSPMSLVKVYKNTHVIFIVSSPTLAMVILFSYLKNAIATHGQELALINPDVQQRIWWRFG